MKTKVFSLLCASVAALALVAAFSSCKKDNPENDPDSYIENGVNHGKGITIAGVTFAPVNCGTDAAHPMGLLYQWGRKDGHGYDGEANCPKIVNKKTDNPDPGTFYSNDEDDYDEDLTRDWRATPDDRLWNAGSEAAPVKTANDPCPEGWRVPTETELKKVTSATYSWDSAAKGAKFSAGSSVLFLPAAGFRERYYNGSEASYRGTAGDYLSSSPYDSNVFYLTVSVDQGVNIFTGPGHTGNLSAA